MQTHYLSCILLDVYLTILSYFTSNTLTDRWKIARTNVKNVRKNVPLITVHCLGMIYNVSHTGFTFICDFFLTNLNVISKPYNAFLTPHRTIGLQAESSRERDEVRRCLLPHFNPEICDFFPREFVPIIIRTSVLRTKECETKQVHTSRFFFFFFFFFFYYSMLPNTICSSSRHSINVIEIYIKMLPWNGTRGWVPSICSGM